MTIVGSAHVVIRAITDKLEGDIKKALENVKPGAKKSGADAGAEWSKSFGFSAQSQMNGGGIFKNINDAASGGGRHAGRSYGSMFMLLLTHEIKNKAARLASMGSGIGRNLGASIVDGFKTSGASNMFISIGLRMAALIPIIGALVGAISNLVSGLFAFVAAAGSAANSLIVLGGLLNALVFAAGTSLIAFGGVGEAVSAGMKAIGADTAKSAAAAQKAARDATAAVADAQRNLRKAHEQAANGIRDALEGVRDARLNVTRTYEDAARAEEDAIDGLARAEDNLRRAHDNVRSAQEALTQARKDAREELIDLQFASEQGLLSERRAQLALADAKFELEAASGLPSTNRVRIEAELAFKEADLNLRMIRERNGDIAEEQKKAKKNGVEGSEAVQSAKEQLKNAEDSVADAVDSVADALENQTRVQEDNARAIRDSNEALRDAKDALKDAYEDAPQLIRDAERALADTRDRQREANEVMRAGGQEASEYQKALEKLSPAARSFVEYLVSIREKLLDLRRAAAEGLFPGLEDALRLIVDELFPTLERALFKTGRAVGNAAKHIAESITSGPFKKNFRGVVDNNARSIERMGEIFGDLTRIVFALLDAAAPLIDRFTEWLRLWTRGKRVTTEAKNSTGALSLSFQEAGDRMAQVSRIVGNIIEGLFDLGRVAKNNGGLELLNVFEGYTERFANFTDNAKNRTTLGEFFQSTTTNFLALSSLIHEIGAAFFRLGASPAIGSMSKALEGTVAQLESLITHLLENSGDEIVAFIDSILEAFEALSDSGALNVFLGVLTGVMNAVSGLAQNSVTGPVVKFLLSLGAAMYALSLVKKFPGIAQLSKTFTSFNKRTGLTDKAMGKLSAGFKKAGKFAGEKAKSLSKGLIPGLKNGTKAAGSFASTLTKKVVAGVILAKNQVVLLAGALWTGIKAKLVSIGMWIRTTVVMLAHKAAAMAVRGATLAWAAAQRLLNLALLMNPIGIVIAAILALVAIVVIAYKKNETFRKIVDKAWEGIKKAVVTTWQKYLKPAFMAIWKFIKDDLIPIITWLWKKVVKPYYTFIGNLIKATWDKVIKPVFKALWGFIKNTLGPIFNWIWNKIIKPVFKWIGDLIRNTWRSVIKPVFQAMRDFIGDKLVPAFQKGIGAIGRIWNGLKRLAAAPVNFLIDTVYNDGIRALINRVLGFFGSERKLPTVPRINLTDGAASADAAQQVGIRGGGMKGFPTNFRGGVIPGYTPGRDVTYSAVSGGEAIMRPEWTKALGRDRVHEMNAIARQGGVQGVRSYFAGKFARGGVVWPTTFRSLSPNYGGHTGVDINLPGEADYGKPVFAAMSGLAQSLWGGDDSYGNYVRVNHDNGFETIYAHLAGPGRSGPVKAGDQIGSIGSTGNSTGSHLHFEVRPGGTYDSALAFLNGSLDPTGGTQSGGGGFLPKIARRLLGGIPNVINNLMSKMPGADSGFGRVLSKIPGFIVEKASDFVTNLIGGSGTDSLPSGATGPIQEMARTMAGNQHNWTGGQWTALRELVQRESSWNPLAQNPSSSAYGLFQFLDSTWETVGGRKTSNPRLQTLYGLKYISERYGNPASALAFHDANNYYDRGGIARGENAWIPKKVAAPERVLSPRQTEAFERLVDTLDRGPGAGAQQINLDVHVPQDASARDVVDGIVYELRRSKTVRGGRYRR